MKQLNLLIFASFFTLNVFGQQKDFKSLAFEAFNNENYPLAISNLQKALETNPNDKELYYYLGYYTHYNAYDSRPLKGYDLNYSDTVFYFLNKALALDPNYGDAKYFYTAECGANAFHSLQQKDYKNFVEYYNKAFEIGGFPDWLTEYGRLILNQVDKNGILFTHGDLQLNTCWYLQYCEGYRTDITVIPLAILNRPFFVKEIKNGNFLPPVKMNISDEQIMDMHPYKWKETTIEIPVPNELIKKYKLNDSNLSWKVSPDLKGIRDYLSCEKAMLLEIIESNNWERPIYWTLGMDIKYLGGLHVFGSYKGLVYKLMPFETKATQFENDITALESMIDSKNFEKYNTILKTNQPRVSVHIPWGYSNAIMKLFKIYKENDQVEKITDLKTFYENNFKIGLDIEFEEYYINQLKQ
jgi:tetratricopeptide (TPR) repeat protein